MQSAITDAEQNIVFRFGLVLRRYNKSFKNATKPFTTHPQQKVSIVVLHSTSIRFGYVDDENTICFHCFNLRYKTGSQLGVRQSNDQCEPVDIHINVK
jgi:hypothetical protein